MCNNCIMITCAVFFLCALAPSAPLCSSPSKFNIRCLSLSFLLLSLYQINNLYVVVPLPCAQNHCAHKVLDKKYLETARLAIESL